MVRARVLAMRTVVSHCRQAFTMAVSPEKVAEAPAPSGSSRAWGAGWIWPLVLLCGAALLAVTNRTFWIDECVSAQFASEPTLAGCWAAMRRFPEIQLPFYMLYLWSYIKVFGSGEWVLRMAGFPWLVGGAALFVVAVGRAVGSRMLVALLVAWSPFAWFYLNEARVYSIQLGLALAVVGAGVALLQSWTVPRPLAAWARVFTVRFFRALVGERVQFVSHSWPPV